MIRLAQELRQSRPLQTAVAASLLWHLIWLFVIYIDMRDPGVKPRLEPKIYFVGPILSDEAFNMILDAKPELSRTEYRTTESSSPSLEPQPQTMERANPGDLVSVPLGQSTWAALRGHLKSDKPYPEALFRKKLQTAVVTNPYPIERGPLARREIQSIPPRPSLPEADAAPGFTEFELAVLGSGSVQEARLVVSSGDPETDLIIERYLKQWQFAPLDDARRETIERGHIRVPVSPGDEG